MARDLPPGIEFHKRWRLARVHYSEDREQMELFERIFKWEETYPQLQDLFHVANQGAAGRAGRIRQAKLQRMGLRPGVWDVLDVHNRLVLEMKANYNNLSPDQVKMAWRYHRAGIPMYVCWTARDAWFVVRKVLRVPVKEDYDND